MSVIHEFLSHDGHNPINVRDVCQRIAGQVVEVARGPSQHIDVRVQGPSIRLPASQATPVALVLNELLMNAIEHGVRDRAQSAITLVPAGLHHHAVAGRLDGGTDAGWKVHARMEFADFVRNLRPEGQ